MRFRKKITDTTNTGNKYLARAKKNDRLAAWLINIGGFLVILSVISILVLILKVAIPLFLAPEADAISTVSLAGGAPTGEIKGMGVDDSLQAGFVLGESGTFTFFDTRSGKELSKLALAPPGGGKPEIAAATVTADRRFDILWKDGSFTALKIAFPTKEGSHDSENVTPELITLMEAKGKPGEPLPLLSMARFSDENSPLRVDLLPGNRFTLSKKITSSDLLGNETVKEVRTPFGDELPGNITAVALDSKGENLYAGTDTGRLLRWDLSDPGAPRLLDSVRVNANDHAVTALNLVLGDNSVAVADADGALSTWFPASETGLSSGKTLTRIHPLAATGSAITNILPSTRSKTLYSLDKSGAIRADHMTSERHLLDLRSAKPLVSFAVANGDNGAIGLDTDKRVTIWRIANPHPEVSLKTMFAPVWYENYDKPAYVWQSSAANDDFEPKLSLTPLIFGTMKGTLYAMIFAVPLALLGAIYTSQFMGARLKKIIKPAIEIMAAIPSVVIGFLAGLWLAPLMDKAIVSFFLAFAVIPLLIFLSILVWQRIGSSSVLKRFSLGYEFLFLIPALLIGLYVSQTLGGVLEASLFAGDFKLWLYDTMGIRSDQRNSIIIAFALGLAVIPLIFTMAEDALSNVPKNLSAASLAIGASRWQTAWRIVVPSALPGIFSAIMIGFGRAVGETMIVLMATGNTPILDWSIFNGFRSLSANIAVEIPEAPVFGTLYRVLFLSAVLLFIFTFIINTVAEILRQKFRKKYGRF
ncbi:MAG: ABC transporter permease subunit [Deltaproteobacteria bacterium]|nr:ABC transporter permease subunit [Deltaproteobacteria bacterium]